MGSVRRQLASGMPEVEVTEYDAEERRLPSSDFDWLIYDVIVLTYELGEESAGLVWLKDVSGVVGFPPVLVLANELDVYATVRLMHAGAGDILLRRDIDTEALVACVERLSRIRSLTTRTQHDELIVTRAVARRTGRERTVAVIGEHRYAFMRLIGQGGMARAYLAQRMDDGVLMVVKAIDSQRLRDQVLKDRFLAEAELAKSVDHAHVVNILDVGIDDDFGMMAMEFFPGGDLKARIEGGLTEELAVHWFKQIVQAIGAIAAHGIVHRDLKPGNLMFRADGQLALADFGIAKRLNDGHLETTSGHVMGTPAYFSPEQARGAEVDTRTDLYSAGIILFEMLAGVRPYEVPTIESMIYHHVHADIPRLPTSRKRYQPLIDRLLAKNPDARFRNADDVLNALPTY